jgi:phenylalanyl-tRNA synthetase alpha subunit
MSTIQDPTYPARNNSLSVAALILASIALVLSALAFFDKPTNTINTTSDIPEESSTVLQNRITALEQQSEINKAQRRLADLSETVATNSAEAQEQVQQEITQLRANLREQFQNADTKTQRSWQTIDVDLEQIEQGLREGSVDALSSLERAITALRLEISNE